MKSPPPETGAPETRAPETGASETGAPETGAPETGVPETGVPETEKEKHEAETKPSVKSQVQSESEKDSGYSDSSSESLGSEETNGSAPVNGPGTVHTAYTSIYILQNVVLKQPRLLLLQPPVRRHRKRPAPSSYLPILRSYPRIAPRLAPLPSPPITRPPAPHLLEVSLRSLALLRRTRESQRSIRELRAHARLYERALQGETGGWERLQNAMEQSGGYRKIQSSETSPRPATSLDVITTSSGDGHAHKEETMTSSPDDDSTVHTHHPSSGGGASPAMYI